MNLVGLRVNVFKLGNGTIISHEDSVLKVEFDDGGLVKKYKYPDCLKANFKILDERFESINTEKKDQVKDDSVHKVIVEKEENVGNHKSLTSIKNKQVDNDISLSFNTIGEFTRYYISELKKEIHTIKESNNNVIKGFKGRLIYKSAFEYVYSFEVEEDYNYHSEFPIKVEYQKEVYEGFIVDFDNYSIIISISQNIGDKIDEVLIKVDASFVLEKLIERILKLKFIDNGITYNLICNAGKEIDENLSDNIKGQENAIIKSVNNPITFIWGPPGTGKTETLAKIVIESIKNNKRVLMLSHSNVSVDGAILRADKLYGENTPGRMIRYGYPREEELLNHEYLTLYGLASLKNPKLKKDRDELLKKRKKFASKSKEYIEITKRLKENKKVAELQTIKLLDNANFIATTASKAVVDKYFDFSSFDIVIFDEVSMAYIPFIAYASSLAKENLICIGDFNQLPPIVQNDFAKGLFIDIFRYYGIEQAVKNNYHHDLLCILDTQYRMYPNIAEFINKKMYNNNLSTFKNLKNKLDLLVASEPLAGTSLGMVDLSNVLSLCAKTKDSSRVNILSAFISIILAVKVPQKYSVAIITPYRDQAKLIRAIIKDINIKDKNIRDIGCSTVHQFQGSEKDVIIYDIAESYNRRIPGKLITSVDNNTANRLFNVAVTRAKGKFIAVMNTEYMNSRKLPENLLIKDFIDALQHGSDCISGKELINKYKASVDKISMGNNEVVINNLIKCINESHKEIRIDIPDRIIKSAYMTEIIKVLVAAADEGIEVSITTKNKELLPKELREYSKEDKSVFIPITIIDTQHIFYGFPITSKNENSDVLYFKGKEAGNTIIKMLNMSNRNINNNANTNNSNKDDSLNKEERTDGFAKYVEENTTCTKCGSNMVLRKGKGKYFLGCKEYPKCDKTGYITTYMLDNYLNPTTGERKLCPKCGAKLSGRLGRYGIYVACEGADRHIIDLREI